LRVQLIQIKFKYSAPIATKYIASQLHRLVY